MNVVTPKRFTIDEYYRLIELGFFKEGERIELIRGELIQVAKGMRHTVCSSILCRQLDRLLNEFNTSNSYSLRLCVHRTPAGKQATRSVSQGEKL